MMTGAWFRSASRPATYPQGLSSPTKLSEGTQGHTGRFLVPSPQAFQKSWPQCWPSIHIYQDRSPFPVFRKSHGRQVWPRSSDPAQATEASVPHPVPGLQTLALGPHMGATLSCEVSQFSGSGAVLLKLGSSNQESEVIT